MAVKLLKNWKFWLTVAFLALNAGGWALFLTDHRKAQMMEVPQEYEAAVEGDDQEPVTSSGAAYSASNAAPSKSVVDLTEATAAKDDAQKSEAPMLLFNNVFATMPSFGQGSLSLEFSSPVSTAEAAHYIEIEPKVELSFFQEWNSSAIKASGEFEPGESYQITVRKGFSDRQGTKLAEEVKRSVKMPTREAAITLAVEGRYLAPQGNLLVPATSIGIGRMVTRVHRVPPQNLVQLAMRESDRYRGWYRRDAATMGMELGECLAIVTNLIDSGANEAKQTLLPLRTMLKGKPQRGVFALIAYGYESGKANIPEETETDEGELFSRLAYGNLFAESKLVCITDVGLSARQGDESLTVWVTSLSQGTALPGCQVQLFTPAGIELAQGVSDSEGLLEFALTADKEPFLLAAKNGNDETFMVLKKHEAKAARKFLKAGETEAFVMTDRGIYRHGETIIAQALLRTGAGEVPKPMPVNLSVERLDGTGMANTTVTPDELGAVLVKIPIPESWRSGGYDIQLRLPGKEGKLLGSARVLVESFVPPQIRVMLEDVPVSITNHASFGFSLAARHLFGAPAAGLKGTSVLLLSPQPFKPDGWSGWTFGDDEKKFEVKRRELGSMQLGSDGLARFNVDIDVRQKVPALLQGIIEGTVLEAGGRALSARQTFEIHAYPFYVGIQTKGARSVEVNRETQVRFASVLPSGQPLKDQPKLNIRLERIHWMHSLRMGNQNHYEWVSERNLQMIKTDENITDGKWTFLCGATGDYLLTVYDPVSGASTSWPFWAGKGEEGTSPLGAGTPDKVELVCDKPFYRPGDSARVQIRAPFAGTAWVSIQREEILGNYIVNMTNNTTELMIPLENWTPNVEVEVSVVRPAVAEAVWRAHRASGKLALRIIPPERELKVTVAKPAPLTGPRRSLPVAIGVRTLDGAPAARARVTLFAVDEGVCMLTNHKVPNPTEWFMTVRDSGMTPTDIYAALMPIGDERMWGTASHTGGDEGDELLKRLNPVAARRFKPLALHYINVAVNAQGQAEIPVDLPEFAGELRLMAVAWDDQGTGCSEDAIIVRRDVVVQPDMPRVMAPGDQATGVIALYNEGEQSAEVQVKAHGVPPLSVTLDQQLKLEKGASTLLPMPLEAAQAIGTGRLSISVTGGDDTPYQEEFELAVRPTQSLTREHETVSIKAGQSFEFEAPAGLMLSTARQRLSCSALPVVNLISAVEYLWSYPYGCLEQTISSAFPWLALSVSAGILPVNNGTLAAEAPARIAMALKEIKAMSRNNGYTMWPDSLYLAPYETIYAAHFLVEAQRAGHAVSAEEIEHVTQVLRRFDQAFAPYEPYALYVLALAGKPDAGRMLRQFETLGTLDNEKALLLARALALSGEATKARAALEKVTGIRGIRQAAFGLMTLAELDTDSPLALDCLREIESARGQELHWGTTQNNALALMALGLWQAATQPAGDGDISLEIAWLDNSVTSGMTNRFNWATDRMVPVKVINKGTNTLYATHSVEGVPLNPLPATEEGVRVQREWLTVDGQPADMERLKRGELLVVRISIDLGKETVDDLIVEDLLPACLEIECADLAPAGTLNYIEKESSAWVLHKEARDDRMLLFSKRCKGELTFAYSARLVSSGEFSVPAVSATRMYEPSVKARSAVANVRVYD